MEVLRDAESRSNFESKDKLAHLELIYEYNIMLKWLKSYKILANKFVHYEMILSYRKILR